MVREPSKIIGVRIPVSELPLLKKEAELTQNGDCATVLRRSWKNAAAIDAFKEEWCRTAARDMIRFGISETALLKALEAAKRSP